MAPVPFSECWARSYFSFLEGASSPEALVERARELEMPAIGLVDRGGLYGAVRLVRAARRLGVRAMVGAELDLHGGGRLAVLAPDRPAYQQLCRAVSRAQLAGVKGAPRLCLEGLDEVLGRAAGAAGEVQRDGLRPAGLSERIRRDSRTRVAAEHLVRAADLDRCVFLLGGPHSPVSRALRRGERSVARDALAALQAQLEPQNLYLCLQHHLHPGDDWLAAETASLAGELGVAVMASAAPRYARAGDGRLLDVLTAIRHGCTLEEAAASGLLLPNHEYWMRDGAGLAELLPHPEAMVGASELASRADLELDFRHSRFPGLRLPPGVDPDRRLRQLCEEGIPDRYPGPREAVDARLAHELEVIGSCHLAEFFLIVAELMHFARREGIPAQGRGSAADSLVAYLLGITRVDPLAHNLLFERFLHEGMESTPDIDIDVSTTHRERLIQHVYDTYGEERTGMVCTVITFRLRLALRQVGAALGIPDRLLEQLAKAVDRDVEGEGGATLVERLLAVASRAPSEAMSAREWRQFADLVDQVVGVPRHLSIHVGGMLVTGEPLWDIAPLERATRVGRVVVQFDKDDVEDLGLIKIDLLGLRTLSALEEALTELERVGEERPDLDRLDLADPEVYEMCSRADTVGVFQIESRAQQQTLPRARPREFNDLVVEVAIIRPGPIQGKAVHPYLRRRQGKEPVSYLHPRLEPILQDTLGVILYQEQIIEIAMSLAGFSAARADRFRRAMNRHRSREEMDSLEAEFLAGCRAQGVEDEIGAELFAAVRGFAEFGFCRSHAAAFARTAYETAWLRLHHPEAYLVGLLNLQPMGFYHPSVLVDDARRHGVAVLPVDVNHSASRCRVERQGCGLAVRLGFNYVKGVGEVWGERLDAERRRGEYRSPEEFWFRTRLSREAMGALVLVGALDGFAVPRRELLWRLRGSQDEIESSGQPWLLPLPAPPPALPPMTPEERLATDYHFLGLSTGPHPVELLRPRLAVLGAVRLQQARAAEPGARLTVLGMVITRQAPPSAHGMRFFTLADETGHLDLVIPPEVHRRHRQLAHHRPLICAQGVMRAVDGVVSMAVERLLALPEGVASAAPTASHDYR
ncbi:MAG: DNA polymerase III subunit alpha [Candidatus Dormibacteria bacterium]